MIRHLAALLVLSLPLGACDEAPTEERARLFVVLIDGSASARSEPMQRLYIDSCERIVSAASHGDAFIAAWITDHSVTEPEMLAEASFPPFRPGTDNRLMIKGLRRTADEKLAEDVGRLRMNVTARVEALDRKIGRTDIIGSLDLANRVLAQHPDHKKIRLILSDMIEDSSSFNFEKENLSDERIEEIFGTLRESRRIPDLRGVRAYVIGASHPDDLRYRRIREFWIRFFAEAGADLRPEDYGTTLIRFEPETDRR